uniref:Uncharacterized protein n=1 Tax=Peronospora matthiolae TaxID=2874970 RepID=A0AAV1TTB6_9STRA
MSGDARLFDEMRQRGSWGEDVGVLTGLFSDVTLF